MSRRTPAGKLSAAIRAVLESSARERQDARDQFRAQVAGVLQLLELVHARTQEVLDEAVNDALIALRDGRRPVKADADRLQDCSEILNQVVADLDGRPLK